MSLQQYLAEINAYPLLDDQEQRDLAALTAQGDYEAREKLIQGNLRFVVKVARRMLPNRKDDNAVLDAIGDGNIGLIKAAEEYDGSMAFLTYAAWWIEESICRNAFMSRHAMQATPRVRKLAAKMRRLRIKSEEEAIAAGMSADDYYIASNFLASKYGPGDKVADPIDRGPTAEDAATIVEGMGIIRDRWDRLDPQEREATALHFGLDGNPPLSLQELGEHFGITKSQARRVIDRAKDKLRKSKVRA